MKQIKKLTKLGKRLFILLALFCFGTMLMQGGWQCLIVAENNSTSSLSGGTMLIVKSVGPEKIKTNDIIVYQGINSKLATGTIAAWVNGEIIIKKTVNNKITENTISLDVVSGKVMLQIPKIGGWVKKLAKFSPIYITAFLALYFTSWPHKERWQKNAV